MAHHQKQQIKALRLPPCDQSGWHYWVIYIQSVTRVIPSRALLMHMVVRVPSLVGKVPFGEIVIVPSEKRLLTPEELLSQVTISWPQIECLVVLIT